MSERTHHRRSRLPGRSGRPAAVRLVRRAPRPLRLHRHLRAGATRRRTRHGFREDVADLVRELGVPIIRYPGGNFVSGYHWEDGIGPVAERPTRLDLAWRSIETNAGRHGRVLRLVPAGGLGADAGGQPRHPGRGRRRAAGGVLQPSRRHVLVRPAAEERRGRAARRAGVVPGQRDGRRRGRSATRRPTSTAGSRPRRPRPCAWSTRRIELVACGSLERADADASATGRRPCSGTATTYVDYVSLHSLLRRSARTTGTASWPAPSTWTASSRVVVATADHVRAKGRHRKRINLSFDEWNVWHHAGLHAEDLDWERAPRLIEDTYTVTDAVVVGNLLISLLRHADRVRIACLAQLVNVIAPIRSEPGGPAWRQTIFHPFALTSRYGRGTVLRTPVTAPVYDTPAYGSVPKLDAVAVLADSGDELTVFAVNRDQRAAAARRHRRALAAGAARRAPHLHRRRRAVGGQHPGRAGPDRAPHRRRLPSGRRPAGRGRCRRCPGTCCGSPPAAGTDQCMAFTASTGGRGTGTHLTGSRRRI